jgi:hypothetical protein
MKDTFGTITEQIDSIVNEKFPDAKWQLFDNQSVSSGMVNLLNEHNLIQSIHVFIPNDDGSYNLDIRTIRLGYNHQNIMTPKYKDTLQPLKDHALIQSSLMRVEYIIDDTMYYQMSNILTTDEIEKEIKHKLITLISSNISNRCEVTKTDLMESQSSTRKFKFEAEAIVINPKDMTEVLQAYLNQLPTDQLEGMLETALENKR